MRVKSRCVLLTAILLTVALLCYLHPWSLVPNRLLLHRIAQLEAQNSKLHDNLQTLSFNLYGMVGADSLEGQDVEEEASLKEEGDTADSKKGEGCETVHIAVVVSGSLAIRRLMVVVKSILFYRHNPLHFHFVTNTRGKLVLSAIFGSWKLPETRMSYYSISDAIGFVKWIPNSHYSGVFGLAKLTLSTLLPDTLDAVIVLDTDLMLAADIAKLWRFSKELKKGKKLLALVENQSNWYLGSMWKSHKPWPALGRGFNTGVALLNLEQMRERNWTRIWHTAAEESLKTHSKASLADQDVINAAIQRDKALVFILPCVWNVQLSEKTLSDYCFKSAHDFKIIHWNSAAKLDVRNIYAPHFKNLYTMFEDYNSMLFRTHLSGCKDMPKLPIIAEELDADPCVDVRQEAQLSRRVHPYYLNYSYSPEGDNDVTLVAQLSVDRLHMLESLCLHWEGPLSVALYASDADLTMVTAHIAASRVLRDSRKLALHVVFKDGQFYPVNHLRNIALDYVQTPYVYLSDIDFLPMPHLYHYLKEGVRVLGAERRALIVPAFESLLYHVDFPANKSQLISMLQAGKLFTFRYHIWKQGHSPTNFKYWETSPHPYKVKWAKDFEPYLVVRRNVTRYDERFIGFGWNKVSHVMELVAQDYELVVLPEAFMVHMPHAPSPDMVGYRQSEYYRDCMLVLKREFSRMLKAKYSWSPRNN